MGRCGTAAVPPSSVDTGMRLSVIDDAGFGLLDGACGAGVPLTADGVLGPERTLLLGRELIGLVGVSTRRW